ncbi:MAG: hypothetical protein QMB55_11855 [Propionivibrio sp.]
MSVLCIAAAAVEPGAVGELGRAVFLGEVDLGQAEAGEVLEFAGVRNAVLVEVAPEAEVGVAGVLGVDPAVGVAVEFAQGGVAVSRGLPVGEQGVVAEEFAAGVDRSIAVAVEDEQAVVGLGPRRSGLDAVGVVVEMCSGFARQLGDFDSVAVKVEDQRGIVSRDVV